MTELEKLIKAAELIQDISHGKLELCPTDYGYAYIRADDDAYLAMDMVMRNDISEGYVDVQFQAHVRRMGSSMSAQDLTLLQQEVDRVHALVTALGIPNFHPTQADLMAFHDYLVQAQSRGQIQVMEMQSM